MKIIKPDDLPPDAAPPPGTLGLLSTDGLQGLQTELTKQRLRLRCDISKRAWFLVDEPTGNLWVPTELPKGDRKSYYLTIAEVMMLLRKLQQEGRLQ